MLQHLSPLDRRAKLGDRDAISIGIGIGIDIRISIEIEIDPYPHLYPDLNSNHHSR